MAYSPAVHGNDPLSSDGGHDAPCQGADSCVYDSPAWPSVSSDPVAVAVGVGEAVGDAGWVGGAEVAGAGGAAGDWSAVYLKDNLGTSAGFASLGFAAFSVTMTLGRGVGDRLLHRFGVVPVIRVCGLLATLGLGAALATSVPGVTIVGFTLFGGGLSIVVPQVFAAGGRADPDRPGSGLAKVVGLGHTGMTAGPAIVGLAANKLGLHLALVIPLVLAAWIAVAAPALRAPDTSDHKDPIAVMPSAGIP